MDRAKGGEVARESVFEFGRELRHLLKGDGEPLDEGESGLGLDAELLAQSFRTS